MLSKSTGQRLETIHILRYLKVMKNVNGRYGSITQQTRCSLMSETRSSHLSRTYTMEKNLYFAQQMKDAVFIIPKPSLLQEAVQLIDDMHISSQNLDTQGDIYEYLLSQLSTAGKNGQFRTPRHIIRMMVELVDPDINDRICDPACGTAGFLIASYEHILKTIYLGENAHRR